MLDLSIKKSTVKSTHLLLFAVLANVLSRQLSDMGPSLDIFSRYLLRSPRLREVISLRLENSAYRAWSRSSFSALGDDFHR